MAVTTDARVLGPAEGNAGFLGSIGVRFMVDGDTTAERFSLVEHPMSARALAAPLHRHTREDEYSYVVEGRMGALLGDDVLEAGPGDLVFKPRGEWHTFWNAGDEPCRILEIIAPAGFERFFAELVDLGGAAQADPELLGALCRRYELEMDPRPSPGWSSASGWSSPPSRSELQAAARVRRAPQTGAPAATIAAMAVAQLTSGRELIAEARRKAIISLSAANVVGGVVIFLFLILVLPAPSGTPAARALRLEHPCVRRLHAPVRRRGHPLGQPARPAPAGVAA